MTALTSGLLPRPQRLAQSLVARRRQSWLVAAIIVGVLCLDQFTKAWGWRNASYALVDSGGGLLGRSVVGAWFEDPRAGAAIDFGDAVLVARLLSVLVRRRRSLPILISVSFVLAGWVSDLGDRLGLHHWTAPESSRGVVDFLPLAGKYWNVADFSMVAGTFIMLVSLCVQSAHSTRDKQKSNMQ